MRLGSFVVVEKLLWENQSNLIEKTIWLKMNWSHTVELFFCYRFVVELIAGLAIKLKEKYWFWKKKFITNINQMCYLYYDTIGKKKNEFTARWLLVLLCDCYSIRIYIRHFYRKCAAAALVLRTKVKKKCRKVNKNGRETKNRVRIEMNA